MALFEDLLKGNVATGVAVGIGAVVLRPVVAPAFSAVLRPVLKGVIKAGMYAYDQGSVALAHFGELAGDIVAEARSELEPPRTASAVPEEAGSHHGATRSDDATDIADQERPKATRHRRQPEGGTHQ